MKVRMDGVSRDPICGKPVVEGDCECVEYKRRRYFFCSAGCKGRFERRTERLRMYELARLGALFEKQRVRWGMA